MLEKRRELTNVSNKTGSNTVLTTFKIINMKKMFSDVHREIEKILHPIDPIGFYVLIPFVLLLMFLFA